MLFSAEDRSLFLVEFGQDIPVKLAGVPVKTMKGILQSEIISDSANEMEIGSSVLTLQLDRDEYHQLDRNKRYTFFADGFNQVQSGPPVEDGSGFVKLHLTRA